MTIYLVSAFIRREFPLWSLGVEAAIATNAVVGFAWEGRQLQFATRTSQQKLKAYRAIAARLVTAPPALVRQVCTEFETRYGIDFAALLDRNMLTPSMIAEMRASGLVEFGAHSVHHASLGRLDEDDARQEIAQSKRECEELLGIPVQHFAYPYGDRQSAGAREAALCRELGFRTAVTTESNTIFAADHERPYLLPRLTFNGEVQNTPLLHLLLSGVLPGLRRALRARSKLNVPSNTASNQDVGPTAGVLDRSTTIGGGAIKW
jgi:peptidoglycan/xylan/chitin deacetylase (PgdA/CDA1 family)